MKGPIKTIIYVSIAFFLVIALVWKALTYIVFDGEYNSRSGYDLYLTKQNYFNSFNSSVLFYNNFYPEGKQGGIEVILHDNRIITNCDLRIEPTSGMERLVSKLDSIITDEKTNSGNASLVFESIDLKYNIDIQVDKNSFIITLNLNNPLPKSLVGKVGLNLELLPAAFAGKSYIMDETAGIFPVSAMGEMLSGTDGNLTVLPLAEGASLSLTPDNPETNIEINQAKGIMSLSDQRNRTQNGWFLIRSLIPEGVSQEALVWEIKLNHIKGWRRSPKLLHSQVGYHPDQKKTVLVEMPFHVKRMNSVSLNKIEPDRTISRIISKRPAYWGKFLRYHYYEFDFTNEKSDGLYYLEFEDQKTSNFRISREVYNKNVWQPTIDTFFPVQMDHMEVKDRLRIWHGRSHMDDALQAPPGLNHFDGYKMGDQTRTKYKPYEHIPGLNNGGWYDAGDYDIRTISQVSTTFWLALTYDLFDVEWDQTSVDYERRIVELRTPDNKQDILQQVEHGARYLLSCYDNIGHAIPGIIAPTIRQYAHLGDGSTMTDNLIYSSTMDTSEADGYTSGIRDDRLAFTNKSSALDYASVRALALAGKVLTEQNPLMAEKCLSTAIEIFDKEQNLESIIFEGGNTYSNQLDIQKVNAAGILYYVTGNSGYREDIIEARSIIESNINDCAITIGLNYEKMDPDFNKKIRHNVIDYIEEINLEIAENPFRIPYNPSIWGIAWGLQNYAANLFLLNQAYPDLIENEMIFSVLNYVLGVHPGSNVSLVSGVGVHSLTNAYGLNRADYSFIPGGVASGTALIRPDFPELKEDWPFLWQQSEYVIGGAATYVFCVNATKYCLQ